MSRLDTGFPVKFPRPTNAWIGVDLDGTLAYQAEWRGVSYIGPPIRRMVDRVRRWLAAGHKVKIVTARVSSSWCPQERAEALQAVELWVAKHIGVILPVTSEKDADMIELWDNQVIQVQDNTGESVTDLLEEKIENLEDELREANEKEE